MSTTTFSQAATEFAETGTYLARALYTQEETDVLCNHYMELRKEPRPGDSSGVDVTSNDPLKKFPRMCHMHRWDDLSMQWGTDPRLDAVMSELLGESPLLVQTMLYYKPAGARGQALHQDNYYLRAQPGSCVAAWMALDDCDEVNGCLQVVRGTHNIPILCPVKADTTQSFTDVTVTIPEGLKVEPVIMKRGDVLFFNGSVVHGSYPNVTPDRFRRALIAHYVTGRAEEVGEYYHPVYRMDGSLVELQSAPFSDKCGKWVEIDGTPVVELIDREEHDKVQRHE